MASFLEWMPNSRSPLIRVVIAHRASAMRMLLLLLLISVGCSRSAEYAAKASQDAAFYKEQRIRQITAINTAIDLHWPSNTRLARNTTVAETHRHAFDFLVSNRLLDFPTLAFLDALAPVSRVDIASAYGDRFMDWSDSLPATTEFKVIATDLWELGDGPQPMDSLVLATDEGNVVGWKMYSNYAY